MVCRQLVRMRHRRVSDKPNGMSFLETTVLNLPELFQPIRSSSQMSSSEVENKGATDEGGAPRKGTGELTESGEDKRERE